MADVDHDDIVFALLWLTRWMPNNKYVKEALDD